MTWYLAASEALNGYLVPLLIPAVIVACLITIVDRAMNMLKSRGVDLPCMATQLRDMHAWHASHADTADRKLDDLHKWHDIADTEGVKVWYVRPSLEVAIKEVKLSIEGNSRLLQTCMDEQTRAMRTMTDQQTKLTNRMFESLSSMYIEAKQQRADIEKLRRGEALTPRGVAQPAAEPERVSP